MPKSIFLAAAAMLVTPLLAGPAIAQDADQIKLYESVTSVPSGYTVLKRVWVGRWSSVFGVPSYATVEEGAAAFRQIAADLGGNGVINFGCYRKSEKQDASFACNGTVVKLAN